MIIKQSFSKLMLRFPLLGALLAQIISLFFIKLFIQIFLLNIQSYRFVVFQAILSSIITQMIFKLPKWFLYISILFPILLVIGLQFSHVSSWVYGLLFAFFALTFSHTLKERVPLYLSNKQTHEALRKFLTQQQASTFIDLGSGLGGVVRAMNQQNITSVGVESAPLLWGVSALLSTLTSKGKILRKNIWDTDLLDFDVVYAFLSPAIMDKLYIYLHSEMKAGSTFISNSFAVHGVEPDEVWQLSDHRKTKLYFYKIKKNHF
jgi:hypothetical protein